MFVLPHMDLMVDELFDSQSVDHLSGDTLLATNPLCALLHYNTQLPFSNEPCVHIPPSVILLTNEC